MFPDVPTLPRLTPAAGFVVLPRQTREGSLGREQGIAGTETVSQRIEWGRERPKVRERG
jgi:hypothetical protein